MKTRIAIEVHAEGKLVGYIGANHSIYSPTKFVVKPIANIKDASYIPFFVSRGRAYQVAGTLSELFLARHDLKVVAVKV